VTLAVAGVESRGVETVGANLVIVRLATPGTHVRGVNTVGAKLVIVTAAVGGVATTLPDELKITSGARGTRLRCGVGPTVGFLGYVGKTGVRSCSSRISARGTWRLRRRRTVGPVRPPCILFAKMVNFHRTP
jgi:hypothetical protein